MKRLFALMIACLSLVGSVAGQDAEYDATYDKITREYRLNPDGSYDFREYKEITLHTHFAFHRLFGETFIIYNPEYQDLRVNDAYTVMRDGTVVKTPENAYNELLPGFANEAPAWNHLREMAVTHTGLEVGATIHFDYTLTTKAEMMPFFMGFEELKEEAPISEMEILVKVPKDVPLRYKILNIRTAPDIFEENGWMVYRWSFRSLMPASHDQFAYEKGNPSLFFSTAKDLQWAYFTFVNQDAFRSPLPLTLQKKADDLKKTSRDEVALMHALQDLVTDGLDQKNIPGRYTGFRMRPAERVWNSGWATTAEKAVLLAGLLVQAGINAEPVAAVPREWYDPKFGNLFIFEEFFVQVNPHRMDRLYLAVDHSSAYNLIFDMDDKVLVQLDGAVETMRTFEEDTESGGMELSGVLELQPTGQVKGTFEASLWNRHHPWNELTKDSAYAGKVLRDAGKITSSEVRKLTQKEAVLDLTTEKMADTAAGYASMDLPMFRPGIDAWRLGTTGWERRSAIQLPAAVDESYEFELILPGELEYVGDDILREVSNDAGEVLISIKGSGKKLEIKRSIVLEKKLYQLHELRQFSDLVDAWNSPAGRRLVFRPVN